VQPKIQNLLIAFFSKIEEAKLEEEAHKKITP